jgi:hypothetical protein
VVGRGVNHREPESDWLPRVAKPRRQADRLLRPQHAVSRWGQHRSPGLNYPKIDRPLGSRHSSGSTVNCNNRAERLTADPPLGPDAFRTVIRTTVAYITSEEYVGCSPLDPVAPTLFPEISVSEARGTRSSPRVAGELAVVFIGVLLALSADDFRQARSERAEARQSLPTWPLTRPISYRWEGTRSALHRGSPGWFRTGTEKPSRPTRWNPNECIEPEGKTVDPSFRSHGGGTRVLLMNERLVIMNAWATSISDLYAERVR